MAIKLTNIHQYLENVGIKHSNIGYRYIVMAIEIGSEQPEMLFRINDLYETIGEKFNKSPKSVSSAIRNAILLTNQPNKEFIAKAIVVINLIETKENRAEMKENKLSEG